jgi:non-specific serine/threonine protein kinase/serine/threonine-protein kinase
MFTVHGGLLGTPEYMSPEQADVVEEGIDTRTDVYALGVILYELLVGELPFERDASSPLGLDEIRRIIREEEPAPPSVRWAGLGRRASARAALRRVQPSQMIAELRGDLDWIVMKALHKQREHRYASAAELSADVERFLSDEPVSARPPTRRYKVRKFVQRHRLAVSTAVVVLLALITGSVGTTVGMWRALRAEAEATREMRTSEETLQFLTDLFRTSDPIDGEPGVVTARELLERGTERIEASLKDEPEVRARLLHTLGEVFFELTYYDRAEELLTRSLEMRTLLYGEDHPDTLETMHVLMRVYWARGPLERAEALARAVLDGRKRRLGKQHPRTLAAMSGLAEVLRRRGEIHEAKRLFEEALMLREEHLGADHPDTLGTTANLANLYRTTGDLEAAEALGLEALEGRRRVLGPEHIVTMASVLNLASIYRAQGRYEEAEPLFLQALESARGAFGERHKGTFVAYGNLGALYLRQGRFEEAAPLLEKSRRGLEGLLRGDHPHTLTATHRTACLEMHRGRLEQAEILHRRVLLGRRRSLGERHPDTIESLLHLAYVIVQRGRPVEAETLLRASVERTGLDLGVIGRKPGLRPLEDDPAFQSMVASLADSREGTARP